MSHAEPREVFAVLANTDDPSIMDDIWALASDHDRDPEANWVVWTRPGMYGFIINAAPGARRVIRKRLADEVEVMWVRRAEADMLDNRNTWIMPTTNRERTGLEAARRTLATWVDLADDVIARLTQVEGAAEPQEHPQPEPIPGEKFRTSARSKLFEQLSRELGLNTFTGPTGRPQVALRKPRQDIRLIAE